MEWIKRNLVFVIVAVVSLLLMGGAGYYTWSGYSQYGAAKEDLAGKYAELKRLYDSPQSPGDGEKVDNIKAAKEQLIQVNGAVGQALRRFQKAPPIIVNDAALEGTNVSIAQLSRGMSETISRLQREATNSGVVLPPRYNFSFEQEADKVRLAQPGLAPLAAQLSEVKALAEVLIQAKVNSIDMIQRERVAQEDFAGAQNDYIEARSKTNDLAITTPYHIVFRSFTPELASVLCGFAGSPYGIVVKRINVEPSVATAEGNPLASAPVQYYQPPPPPQPASPRYAEERYGKGFPGAPPAPAPVAAPVATAGPTGPRTVLNEKQLKITMQLEMVKPLPPAK